MTKRSPVSVVIFALISCGIYAIYWLYKVTAELEAEAGPGKMGAMVVFLLSLFVPYVGGVFFGMYANEQLNKIRVKKGIAEVDNNVLYIVLGLLLPIVLWAMVQSEMNKLIDADASV